MGTEVGSHSYTSEDRYRFREKIRRNLDVFEQLLGSDRFAVVDPMVGLEIELNLVDSQAEPHHNNAAVLEAIADEDYVTELARFNIEMNVPPIHPRGSEFEALESMLRRSLSQADRDAHKVGSGLATVGILPTLRPKHLEHDWMTSINRYQALNDAILAARGEHMSIDLVGLSGERVRYVSETVAPEAACTSTQLHIQVAPEDFAAQWNAAQAIAAVQVAVGANSPFFFGNHLHAESRISLFEQAIDTRPVELAAQGVRPRVFFGDRWITSIFDLFEENVKFFPVLLAEVGDEDPEHVLAEGGIPKLGELRLHNGTVYRWNRPVYDVVDETPHLRIENRVLPSGPTIIDTLANAALFFGLVTRLSRDGRPLWSRLPFETAELNFRRAASHGIDARLDWPGLGMGRSVVDVVHHLLPLADEGLDLLGVDAASRDRYLGVIAGRAEAHQNGASWQVAAVTREQERGASRRDALTAMTRRYIELMHTNEPVHRWPV